LKYCITFHIQSVTGNSFCFFCSVFMLWYYSTLASLRIHNIYCFLDRTCSVTFQDNFLTLCIWRTRSQSLRILYIANRCDSFLRSDDKALGKEQVCISHLGFSQSY
jgi:hypothetical protein